MRKLAVAFAAAALVLTAATAAEKTGDREDEPELPARKRPSFFNRPAEDAPEPQWALARGLEEAGRLRAAARAYNALVRAWPHSTRAVDAQRALAEVLERRGKYVRAFDEYEYLVSNYAGRFPFGEIVERQFRIANLVMSARHGKFLFVPGFTSPEKAIPLFEKLVAGAPAAGQSAEALFRLAQLHQQARDYAQAAAAFERFQYSHPAGPFREEADLGRAECLYQMARLSPRDETACRDALSCLSVFLRDHPQSPAAGAVRERLDALKRRLADMYYDRALFYDRRHRRKPQAALIAYRDFVANFPGSDRAERARGRIAALERRAEVRDEK